MGSLNQPVILSTGMANLGEIEAAIDVLEQAGTSRNQITVLHCTTEYPAPLDEVNLCAIQTIGRAFGVSVGYSDHTDGIAIPLAAVSMGATVIEKHLTLDRTMEGPDHRASLEPDQFASMVYGIRAIELALGDGIKRPTASERSNLPIVRKSLVAARAIQAGEPFTSENITAKRPGTGISPMHWDELMGRNASRAYAPDELIES
jgi:sialic acid synthase SpsE